jgi:hypothetical protein
VATRRRSRRKSISGNITDVQKRIRYLETRPSASRLASKAVATRNLALRAVEEDIVADNAIVRRSIAASAVGTAEIEQDSITNALIATNAVNSDSIEPGAVGTTELAPDSVTNDKIATDAVNSDSIAPGAVGNTELAGNITDDKISGMSASKLIGQVQDSQINSLSASKVTGTLATSNIPNLDASKITSGVFDLARIPAITADRVPNLDASKITTGTFSTLRIPDLDADKITSGIFATARIPSISADKITSGTFTLARIPTITTAKIGDLQVTNDKIANSTITAGKIATSAYGAIVTGGLSAGTAIVKSFGGGGQAVSLIANVGSGNNQVAAGNHVHGQGGYSNAGSTGVGSHTHPLTLTGTAGGGGHGGHAGSLTGTHIHSISVSGTTSSNTSTQKLKKEISDYEIDDVKKILNLKLKKYKYKNQVRYLQDDLNREWMYGYIAEEVLENGVEEIVGYDENKEPNSLHYGLLSALVLELVKEQQKEIDSLKEELRLLEELDNGHSS